MSCSATGNSCKYLPMKALPQEKKTLELHWPPSLKDFLFWSSQDIFNLSSRFIISAVPFVVLGLFFKNTLSYQVLIEKARIYFFITK